MTSVTVCHPERSSPKENRRIYSLAELVRFFGSASRFGWSRSISVFRKRHCFRGRMSLSPEEDVQQIILANHHSADDNERMKTILDIGGLTKTEKLRAMEELWRDLSRVDDEYASPEWHGQVLKEREQAVVSGQDEFVPWEDAKKMLRSE